MGFIDDAIGGIGNAIKDAGEAIGDIGERALTGVGLKDKDPASVEIVGGELKHNIDLGDFEPSQKAQIEAVLADQADQLETLREQLKEAKSVQDVPKAKMIEADIAKLEAGLTEMKFELEHEKFNFGAFFVGNLIMPGVGGILAQGVGNEADKRMQDAFASAVPPRSEIAVTREDLDTSATDRADAAAGAGGGGAADGTSFDDANIDRMVELASTNPQALMDELKGMKLEDRTMIMNMVQQQLQEINQMFSMMSNMQKSIHDTQKAMINNFRV